MPVFGWLGLRREADLHGPTFWLRPIAVELLSGLALAVLYAWEAHDAARLWALPDMPLPPTEFLTDNPPLAEQLRFVSHAVLFYLMLAASLIDLDEKTIPDGITVPGTLIGLVFAAAYPWSLLPAAHYVLQGHAHLEFLTLSSPELFPASLAGSQFGGLATALGCWSVWCFGLLPRRWNVSRGWSTAARVFCHRLRRERLTYLVLTLWIAVAAILALAAATLSTAHWAGLLTALVGMAAGGGVIWIVRIIGSAVLHKEAMGFGDVTLMAMIGAFFGWQACLMVFFVAPFFGLLFAVGNYVLHQEREIPYGPFLCLGALAVMLKWPWFWAGTVDLFSLGWLVPALLAVCFVLMALLLWVYTLLLRLFSRAG
jgi:leader peptidase (prepilin peptidase) / N-methyltransferase